MTLFIPEVEPIADLVFDKVFPPEHPHARNVPSWIEERLGEYAWSMQREICESVMNNRYTACKACHGPGKSFIAARIAAHWVDTHEPGEAFVVTTAPSWQQVRAILWREIGRAHRKAGLPGRITLDCDWSIGPELVAYGRKPADHDEHGFQGIHARYVLVIVDEASGVPKGLWDAIESLVTNEDSRVLAIGNPDDPTSHFKQICMPGSGYNVISIPADRTPLFTGEWVPEDLKRLLVSPMWVEERRKRWGVDSPLYRAKVDAEFPDASHDTLIQPNWILRAQARELPGYGKGRWAMDVSRYGSAKTVVYRNRDGHCRLDAEWTKKDTAQTVGLAVRILQHNRANRVPMVIDTIGLGAGVYDILRADDWPVISFNGAERARDPERFANRRAEQYWALREMFETGEIDIDEADDELAAQLGSLKWKTDARGRILIESKEDMLKRGMPSPDRADALMMSTCADREEYNAAYELAKQQGGTLTGDLLKKVM